MQQQPHKQAMTLNLCSAQAARVHLQALCMALRTAKSRCLAATLLVVTGTMHGWICC